MPTLLIADDQVRMRESLVGRLQQRGFNLLTASNGHEVLEVVETTKIDLILMDMNMPEMDGWEASRFLKGHPKWSAIPIIALTAYALPGDRARALQAGCDEFHSKPVILDDLLQQITGLLEPGPKTISR